MNTIFRAVNSSDTSARSSASHSASLNHDGTKEGGAKSWSEDPSIVVSFAKALDPDGRQIGIRATFKKDRAAVVDPCRTLTFTLDREAGKLVLAGDVEVVGNCREAVIDVMWRAYQRGVESISPFGRSQTHQDRRQHARSDGRRPSARKTSPWSLRLAPALIQRLKADCLVGSNSERSQSEREVSEVPDEVPREKRSSHGKTTGKSADPLQHRASAAITSHEDNPGVLKTMKGSNGHSL